MTSLSVVSSNSGSADLFLLLVESMGGWPAGPDVGILGSPGRLSLSRFRISGSLFSSSISLYALHWFMKNLAILLNSLMVSCMDSAAGKLFVRSAEG